MGSYLNPGSDNFQKDLRSRIYVDKSELIAELNELIDTTQRFVCVSRPRRFGKTMAANMLAAYYSCNLDTSELFEHLKIGNHPSYKEHLNQHMVIQLNIQEFLSENDSVAEMLDDLQSEVIDELREAYPEVMKDKKSLPRVMKKIYALTKQPFIILIDEWDCLFREYKDDGDSQKIYLDFLRNWLKDKAYVGLAYMTGILPIKKYGTHSALNMFTEYSVSSPRRMAPYFGFTEEEVRELCEKYRMNFEEAKAWYDGYTLKVSTKLPCISIYNPKSVVEAMSCEDFGTYWNQTETYEALKIYIEMNYDGLKDSIVELLAGGSVHIDTGTFTNDMTTFTSRDDVLTLLVHLGYLTYEAGSKTVRIPNKEVAQEYVNSIKNTARWSAVAKAVEDSRNLLQSLWNMDADAVAQGIDRTHQEVSILQYNDENALSYTISLAFYYAREYYTVIRELPTGKGFADVCFFPRKMHLDKPALLIELKWEKSAETAMTQIKKKNYPDALREYRGNLILVGISYSKVTKSHECVIEKLEIS